MLATFQLVVSATSVHTQFHLSRTLPNKKKSYPGVQKVHWKPLNTVSGLIWTKVFSKMRKIYSSAYLGLVDAKNMKSLHKIWQQFGYLWLSSITMQLFILHLWSLSSIFFTEYLLGGSWVHRCSYFNNISSSWIHLSECQSRDVNTLCKYFVAVPHFGWFKFRKIVRKP